jgi:hypothetical protein
VKTPQARVASLQWDAIERQFEERGYAVAPNVLSAKECSELAEQYREEQALPQSSRHGSSRLWKR